MYARFFFLALFGFMPLSAFAATYFFAEGTSTDAEGRHEVVLLFSTATPVNALQGVFILPDAEKDTEISDGGSVVQFWIEHPHNEKGKVSFAGIIPGGFSGEAPLLRFLMKGSAKTITLDKTKMSALRHDGTGDPDRVVIGPVGVLPLQFAGNNNMADSRDITPPQSFVPVVAIDPSLFDGKPFVSFGTKDSESGIARYEIAESQCGIIDGHDSLLAWRTAESPALLQATSADGCVYVRAVDKEGNVRMVSSARDPQRHSLLQEAPALSTARNLYKSGLFLGIIIVTLGGIFFWLRRRNKFLS